MKSLVVYNILSFIKKYKKYLVIYFILIIGFILFEKSIGELDENLFLEVIGLGTDNDLITMLFTFFNISFCILLGISIFIQDMKKTEDIILLRIDTKKWINSKIVSIGIVSFILISIIHAFVIIIFYGKISIFNHLRYFIIHYIFLSFIEYIFILLYLIINKFPYIIIPVSMIILLLISKFSLILELVLEKYFFFLIADILIVKLIEIIMKKYFIFFLEKEN